MLDEKDWSFLLNDAELVTFQANDVIIKEGDEFRYFYRLKSGKVRVEKVRNRNTFFLFKNLKKKMNQKFYLCDMTFVKKKFDIGVRCFQTIKEKPYRLKLLQWGLLTFSENCLS